MTDATFTAFRIEDCIDLERYPITDHHSEARRLLVDMCRQQLADDGCVVLKDFVRPEMLTRLEAETERLSPNAHQNETETNPYNSAADPSLPPEHPKNRFDDRTNGFVAGDRIEPDTILRTIYHNLDFKSFIAAVVGEDEIHEFADPLADLVVNVLKEGRQHPWHFDSNDFIVTMQTRKPEGGGVFQYAPGIRGAHGENFEGVQAILDGDHSALKSLELTPGDLQIFFGRNSLHRVSPVQGKRERHTVIFAYAKEPGFVGRPERAKAIFGRMAPIHERMLSEAVVRTDALSD
ncbi:HalD/BesD family halogenase [Roseibium sediminicola]|uniref:Fe2OG dioxygenase domain-containing protein n=1 Tax=Roseibium sediminicola TaxID=2933272 RepID=A0ABT0H3D8_9HYPH|nr:hypothetical protein [Roseibium sp. CAU 1639]MCK7616193.1 hypothetical protein [Roseibium sp. CAU 1639]